MAKESTKLDQFFREKLSTHEEKPSALAWERLEAKLPQQSKSKTGIWWAAAASVLILLSASYFLIQDGQADNDQVFVAANQPEESNTAITEPDTTEYPETISEEKPSPIVEKTETEKAKPTSKIPSIKSDKSGTSTPSNQSEKLIAQEKVTVQPEVSTTYNPTTIEIDPIEVSLPEINQIAINQTVAEEVKMEQVEEPTYKVTIYSDGIKEGDKNLIASLGKKVEKVEGILGKVDQGFADLQDAKSNLFISLITKKEKAGDSR